MAALNIEEIKRKLKNYDGDEIRIMEVCDQVGKQREAEKKATEKGKMN